MGLNFVLCRSAIKMRDQCGSIFRQAKRDLEAAGLLSENVIQQNHEDLAASDIDRELESLQGKTGVELITKLDELLIKSQTLKHGLARAKRVKLIRSELNKAKKLLAASTDSSQSDGEGETVKMATTKSASSSPSGVNRRTAVLFTRKAQAALKKPEDLDKEKELKDNKQ